MISLSSLRGLCRIRTRPQHRFPERCSSPSLNVCPNVSSSASSSLCSRSSHSCITLSEDEERTISRLVNDVCGSDERDPCSFSSDGNMRQRIALSKAITLVESKLPRRRYMADVLLDRLKHSSSSCRPNTPFRLGIAGPPGAGKSTFVEALGQYILNLKKDDEDNHDPTHGELPRNATNEPAFVPDKLAVLCVDPSSHLTGGSILGDKTRMSTLAHHPRAYVRPSPSSGTLGGVASYTHDAVSLCELSGYGLTIVETVGVGQSEVELSQCVDMFLLLLAPGGGDELQGFKKGIIEAADLLLVNKSDGEYYQLAKQTASEYRKAVQSSPKPFNYWMKTKPRDGSSCNDDNVENYDTAFSSSPPVLLCSAKTGQGLPEIWQTITQFRTHAHQSCSLIAKRRGQNRYWMWKYLHQRVLETVKHDERVKLKAMEIEKQLNNELIAPRVAAGELWKVILNNQKNNNDKDNDKKDNNEK